MKDKELIFKANHAQKECILGLGYWIAENAWVRDHFDDPEELKQSDSTIRNACFPDCDKAGVPFWVQNSVIAYAEDWRKYNSTYHDVELAKKGIYI